MSRQRSRNSLIAPPDPCAPAIPPCRPDNAARPASRQRAFASWPPRIVPRPDRSARRARRAARVPDRIARGMIDRAGNVPGSIFMRLTHVHDNARSALVRLQEFLMRNGRGAGASHELAQKPGQHWRAFPCHTMRAVGALDLRPRLYDIFISSNICNGWAGQWKLMRASTQRSRIQDVLFPASVASIQPANASRISLRTSRSLRPERAGTWKE